MKITLPTFHPALRAIAGAALGLALVVSSASISHAHTEKLQAIEGVDSAAMAVLNQIELQGLELGDADAALVERAHELVSTAKVSKKDEKKVHALADALSAVDDSREDATRAQEAAAAFAKDANTDGLNMAELNGLADDLAASNEKVGSIAALYRQTPGDIDIAGKVEAVEAAVKEERERIAAEKKAAEEKAAAEREAAEQAAENAWQSAEPAGEYVEPAQQAPAPAPAAQSCRANAESLIHSIAPGASVVWDDTSEAGGNQASGLVYFTESIVHLNPNTDDYVWCDVGAGVAVHEAAHVLHGLAWQQVKSALGLSFDQQVGLAEQVADCKTAALGHRMTGYGCSDPMAQKIAGML